MKRDLSTKEIALRFNITIEEARDYMADPVEEEKEISSKVMDAPTSEGSDFKAWYCKNRFNGRQYLIELHGEKICTHTGTCLSQVKNNAGANMCRYNSR